MSYNYVMIFDMFSCNVDMMHIIWLSCMDALTIIPLWCIVDDELTTMNIVRWASNGHYYGIGLCKIRSHQMPEIFMHEQNSSVGHC